MEDQHQFNKKNAQLLTHQINCFLIVLKAYCDKYYIIEDMDKIIMILKHIMNLFGQAIQTLSMIRNMVCI